MCGLWDLKCAWSHAKYFKYLDSTPDVKIGQLNVPFLHLLNAFLEVFR